ncbi:thiol reductant ABC exporter subunit CydC [Halomonas sp. McH1-25]|uniref:thiol reductant ABC exporter subunit CydC n=2 Tax=Halomonas TaxID=2745 RepID=UPI001EF58460|nr:MULTISPECIES: thiol reductant ABC exporter subunit CydC [unclassified Halomonas]MCG7598586.1 thiol reductant ABC exporter subunit CydC [Halomonas sp. McH1-25]MCP1342282.1 thiol reductant ABC exporter subunit CydC [Halomonas sp. FL8]
MKSSNDATLTATFRPWMKVLGRRRRRLWLGGLLILLTVAAAIGLLALSGWFITATAVTGLMLAAGIQATLDIYRPGAGIRFFAVGRSVVRYVERVYNHETVLRLLADLRAGMFTVMTRLDERVVGQLRASEWLNRLTADIDALDSLYLRLLAPPLVALLAIAGIGILLGLFVPGIGVAVAIPLLGLWLWLVVGQARLGLAASRRRIATLDRLRMRSIEQMQGLAELRCYGTLATHRRALADEERALYEDQRRLGRYQALGNALVGMGVTLSAVLALWLGARAFGAGEISGPVMVMMPLAVLAMSEALAMLPSGFTHFGSTLAAAERLNGIASLRGAIREPQAPEALPEGALSLEMVDVSLDYSGTGLPSEVRSVTPALERVSFSVHAGERVALLGESGAGKSSVAKLATRLIEPEQGQVLIGGNNVRQVALGELRSRIGYLTQHAELFHDTLAANLRLGDAQADDARLWDVLSIVDLAAWARELPQGLDTWVGESGRQLSGGQARRVALARVLLCDPDLVILDEPFSGLDATTAAYIASRLDDCLAGRTVIYLAHDEAGLPSVDRALRLREGRLT